MRLYNTSTDSPDVLTDGRWECVRGVQRWVVDESSPVPVDPNAPPVPRCADCEREETRGLRRGLCPVCYYWHRTQGTIDRFQRVKGCAA